MTLKNNQYSDSYEKNQELKKEQKEKINSKKEKVLLAYSGGLDTSVILKWLLNKDYEVICYIADVGQEEDFEEVKKKAQTIGANKVIIQDLKKEFVKKYIFQTLKANAIYEGKYLLGTAIARPLIAKKMVKQAKKLGIKTLAHGCTGKGNDQVRFEIAFYQLMPEVKIISPWKNQEFLDKFQGRIDMINYAKKQGIPISSTLKKPYSMDENLMHISYESGILENPICCPNEEMFLKTASVEEAPNKATKIAIVFEKGIPIMILNKEDKVTIKDALGLYEYLNKIAAINAIGREDLVESRFVGMKSRGVYETPAFTVLLKAHKDLEGLTLDKEVLLLKEMLMPKLAQVIYNGFWFSPEMKFLMSATNNSQENVNGTVYLKLFKGNIIVEGRESPNSLYQEDVASMDIHGSYNQKDALGFIKLQALRLVAEAKSKTKTKTTFQNVEASQ